MSSVFLDAPDSAREFFAAMAPKLTRHAMQAVRAASGAADVALASRPAIEGFLRSGFSRGYRPYRRAVTSN